MKTVLLAGGRGSRLSEETELKPKPMVEIGGEPILCHIMNVYAAAGFEEFVVALGYKGNHIKSFFREYFSATHDLTVDLATGETAVLRGNPRSWRVHLVDTGLDTQTGGRIKRLAHWLRDETFMLTYGDGLADVDLRRVVDFHRAHGKLATVTAVRPPARFGALVLEGDSVLRFSEKPQSGEGWINGGFFVLEPGVLDYVDGDRSVWERAPLERLAQEGQLRAYFHDGFWQPMDTLREKQYLEELWNAGKAPWKIW
jgi:glucose-1-phosphate cytidylyltransferase